MATKGIRTIGIIMFIIGVLLYLFAVGFIPFPITLQDNMHEFIFLLLNIGAIGMIGGGAGLIAMRK